MEIVNYWWYATAALMMASYWIGGVVGYNNLRKDVIKYINSDDFDNKK